MTWTTAIRMQIVKTWMDHSHVNASKAVRRNFFLGGARLSTIFERQRKRGREAPERGRVWEGVSPLPHQGAFAFLRLKLNDLVHTLGGFFGKNLNKKVRRKYIFMENVCSYTKITGNVKNKHKQYDHWHSHDFSTGGKARERSDRVGEWWGEFFAH